MELHKWDLRDRVDLHTCTFNKRTEQMDSKVTHAGDITLTGISTCSNSMKGEEVQRQTRIWDYLSKVRSWYTLVVRKFDWIGLDPISYSRASDNKILVNFLQSTNVCQSEKTSPNILPSICHKDLKSTPARKTLNHTANHISTMKTETRSRKIVWGSMYLKH